MQIFEAAESKLVADVTGIPLGLDGIVLRLRGLPFSCTGEDVSEFTSPVAPVGGDKGVVFVCSKDGKPTGEAFMQVGSEKDAQKCIETKHNGNLGLRYIEIFASSKADLYHAVYSKAFYVAFKGIREYHPPLNISGFSRPFEAPYTNCYGIPFQSSQGPRHPRSPAQGEHGSMGTSSRLAQQFSALEVSPTAYHAGPYQHSNTALPSGRPLRPFHPPLMVPQGPGPGPLPGPAAPFQYSGQHVFMAPYLVHTPSGWTLVPPRQQYFVRNAHGTLQYHGLRDRYRSAGDNPPPRYMTPHRQSGTRGRSQPAHDISSTGSGSTSMLSAGIAAQATAPVNNDNEDDPGQQPTVRAPDNRPPAIGEEKCEKSESEEVTPDESVGSADSVSCKSNPEDNENND